MSTLTSRGLVSNRLLRHGREQTGISRLRGRLVSRGLGTKMFRGMWGHGRVIITVAFSPSRTVYTSGLLLSIVRSPLVCFILVVFSFSPVLLVNYHSLTSLQTMAGTERHQWWKEAVVYQVYTPSWFHDLTLDHWKLFLTARRSILHLSSIPQAPGGGT